MSFQESPLSKIGISKIRKIDRFKILILSLFGITTVALFLFLGLEKVRLGNYFLFFLFSISITYRLSRVFHEWILLSLVKVTTSKKITLKRHFTVDILTTWVPGEPVSLVKQTLKSIKKIKYTHNTVLCLESENKELRDFCDERDIKYFVRKGKNIDAKSGNINNALKFLNGEVVVILDPDHEPHPDILLEVLPLFENREIGFVQTVQAYKNKFLNFVTRGASQETFTFYGPIMMGLNRLGAVQAIGANCIFRREALDSIGGHAAGLTEDYHTSIRLHAKKWKSIYLPIILTKGLVPFDYKSYVHQQLKWTRGALEVFFTVYFKYFFKLSISQRIQYFSIPLYFLKGVVFLIEFILITSCLILSDSPIYFDVYFFSPLFLLFFLIVAALRFSAQQWYIEKDEKGFRWSLLAITVISWWVNVKGFYYALLSKEIPYVPTRKTANADGVDLKIHLPNFSLIVLSFLVVLYTLYNEITPYSLFYLVLLCLINILIITGIYMSCFTSLVWKVKVFYLRFNDFVWRWCNTMILPIVFGWFIYSGFLLLMPNNTSVKFLSNKTKDVNKVNEHYFGYYLDEDKEYDFAGVGDKANVLSVYSGWDSSSVSVVLPVLSDINNQSKFPLWTIEPWTLDNNDQVFSDIALGRYDDKINYLVKNIKSLPFPVFIRFGHEPDNPSYPWFNNSINAAEFYKKAFSYLVNAFDRQGAGNVTWVYTPWRPKNLLPYYPGEEVVDWIGLNILDYNDGVFFSDYYEAYKYELKSLDKPVLITELGCFSSSVEYNRQWYKVALNDIYAHYSEIKGCIVFNKDKDENLPIGFQSPINWSVDQSVINTVLDSLNLNFIQDKKVTFKSSLTKEYVKKGRVVKGVVYNTGSHWENLNIPLTRSQIKKDFKKVQYLGANNITYFEQPYYTKSVLKEANDFGFDVNLVFTLPNNIDYYLDTVNLLDVKTNLLEKVHDLKQYKRFKTITLGNETWSLLDEEFHPPYLYKVREGYLNFISELVFELNNNFGDRFSYSTAFGSRKELIKLNQFKSRLKFLSYFSFNCRGGEQIKRVDSLYKNENYFVSQIGLRRNLRFNDSRNIYVDESVNYNFYNEELSSLEKSKEIKEMYGLLPLTDSGFVGFSIYCWSDAMKDSFTWNGLIDYKGREKAIYRTYYNLLTGAPKLIDSSFLSIETNRTAFFPGNNYTLNLKMKGFDLEGKDVTWIISDEDGIVLPEYKKRIVKNKNGCVLNILERENRNLRVYVFVGGLDNKVYTASKFIFVTGPYRNRGFLDQFRRVRQ